jgi:protein HIRA/HIR1
LYAASSDGTLGVFDFDPEELEGIAPHSVQEQYLQKFDFVPPPIPEGYSHNLPSHMHYRPHLTRITPPPSPVQSQSQTTAPESQNGFGHSVNGDGGERVNMLVAKRKVKRKVVPTNHAPLSTSEKTTVDKVITSSSAPASRSSLFLQPKSSVVSYNSSPFMLF